MNVETQLTVTFTPDNETNTWIQPIQVSPIRERSAAVVADPAAALRISVGKRISRSVAADASQTAALRITPTRCRYARRRFFTTDHAFEHRLP